MPAASGSFLLRAPWAPAPSALPWCARPSYGIAASRPSDLLSPDSRARPVTRCGPANSAPAAPG